MPLCQIGLELGAATAGCVGGRKSPVLVKGLAAPATRGFFLTVGSKEVFAGLFEAGLKEVWATCAVRPSASFNVFSEKVSRA